MDTRRPPFVGSTAFFLLVFLLPGIFLAMAIVIGAAFAVAAFAITGFAVSAFAVVVFIVGQEMLGRSTHGRREAPLRRLPRRSSHSYSSIPYEVGPPEGRVPSGSRLERVCRLRDWADNPRIVFGMTVSMDTPSPGAVSDWRALSKGNMPLGLSSN